MHLALPMKNLLLILPVFLLGMAACEKEFSELPDATQTGANTFGAKVDGEAWVPQGFGIVPTAPLVEASFLNTNSVLITGRKFRGAPDETEMEILITGITGAGTYPLNTNTDIYPSWSGSYGYFVNRRIVPGRIYITDATHTGVVIITRWDTAARICSGTFSFNAKERTGLTGPISVTEGRFDVEVQ